MARSKSQKQQQQQQQQNGGGATEYGAATYGGPGQQQADPKFGNTIATNAQAAPAMMGGKSQLSKQQLQKSILKQLQQLKQSGGSSLAFSDYSASAAGPASTVGASSASEQFSLSELPSALSGAMSGAGSSSQQLPQSVSANTNVPLKVETGAAPSVPKVGGSGPDMFSLDKLASGFKQSGGKLSKQQLTLFSQQLDKLQQKQQGGVGLNEIIVPLILLYATQRYSQGKTFKSRGKPMRKTLRRSRRFRR